MGIKKKIKHVIKKRKEREVAFMIGHHKVVKKEDYICNDERYGYGPAKYVECPKESRIKTTIYATAEIQTFDEIRIRVTIYAYPIISKKKWTYYIHESGVGHHKVVKMEDYICNGESYGPAKYVECPKESRIKTTIYTTSEIQTFDEIRIRVTIYAYPIISKKKWTYYIHESGGGETYDWNGIENDEYYDTPEKAINGGIWYAAMLEH